MVAIGVGTAVGAPSTRASVTRSKATTAPIQLIAAVLQTQLAAIVYLLLRQDYCSSSFSGYYENRLIMMRICQPDYLPF